MRWRRDAPESAEDLLLLRECQQGSHTALQSLFDKYQQSVYDLAYRMLGTHEDAEEMVTEVFLRVWRGCRSFRGGSRVSTWIYQITSNRCLDRIRARKSRQSLALEDLDAPEALADYQAEPSEQPETAYLRSEAAEQLHLALDRLPDEDRMLVTLYHLQGFSYDEIHDITGIKHSNIKSKLFRARQRLKQYLSAYEEATHEMRPDADQAGGLLCAAL